MRYLGIDWGGMRIGLAIGESETKIATPYKVVSNVDEILLIIKQEEVDEVVLGKPIKMSGDADLTEEFNNFYTLLSANIKRPLHLVDERLTSKAADALIGDKKTKAPQDAIAAMLILQTYLDNL